jgi:hypothetical protein
VSTSIDIESARRDWEDGYRRLVAAAGREPLQADRLHGQLDLVTDELRRRVGSTFTIADLARAYPDSERWMRVVVEEAGARPGWARSLAMVGDAAFHLYARGAVDYTP